MSRMVRLRQADLPTGIQALAWASGPGAVILYVSRALPARQRSKAARVALREANASGRYRAFARIYASEVASPAGAVILAVIVVAVAVLVAGLLSVPPTHARAHHARPSPTSAPSLPRVVGR